MFWKTLKQFVDSSMFSIRIPIITTKFERLERLNPSSVISNEKENKRKIRVVNRHNLAQCYENTKFLVTLFLVSFLKECLR